MSNRFGSEKSGSPQIAPVGVLSLLKPPGLTSHDVVARLRRIFRERQIGHGGTLDPGAAGVLPILVGRATKLMPFLMEHKKAYRAEMTLGVATDTQDVSGETTSVSEDFSLPPRALGDVLAAFMGEIEQVPPMTSALKQDGKRLYELARRGETVAREPRSAQIDEIHVRAIWPEGTEALVTGSRVLMDVVCSKGTYIRTLCHDVGARLGCGAHMSFLVRTRVGPLDLSDTISLEELTAAAERNRLDETLLPPETVLTHLARVELGPVEAGRLRRGQAHLLADGELQGKVDSSGLVQVTEAGKGLVCIGKVEAGPQRIQPVRVL